jgi:hypothetical protein
MKQQRWLLSVLILFGLVLLSPAPARAGNTVSMIEELLNVVNVIDSSIPSGSTLDPVLQCLQNPKGALDDCANAIGGDGTSPYLDSVLDIIQIFEDLAKSDYDGVLGVVVKWIGSDAPCIVADIMFPGVGGDLCELAKELIEAAIEVGQDIAVFFADVGEGFLRRRQGGLLRLRRLQQQPAAASAAAAGRLRPMFLSAFGRRPERSGNQGRKRSGWHDPESDQLSGVQFLLAKNCRGSAE